MASRNANTDANAGKRFLATENDTAKGTNKNKTAVNRLNKAIKTTNKKK